MITAHTRNGSVYQIDPSRQMFRRVKESSPNKTLPLGEWLPYIQIFPEEIALDKSLVIYHGSENSMKRVISSNIQMLIES